MSKQNPCRQQAVKKAQRQMLHAFRLGFSHPATGEERVFEAPLPDDMVAMIKALRIISPC